MPILTNPRHEALAQALAKGLTAEKAYAEAGYKPHRQNAHRLMTNDDIQGRVVEFQAHAAARTVTTVEDMIRQLDEDRDFARDCGQASAAISASMGKAKLLGFLTNKVEVKHAYSDMSDAELDAELITLMAEVGPWLGLTPTPR